MMFAGPPVAAPNPAGTPPQLPLRYLGRQPIVDEKLQLLAYELLYRSEPAHCFSGDPEVGTREVIDHCLMLLPDSGKVLSFINCTRASLMDGSVSLLSPHNTVLEILEDVPADSDLVASCARLRKQGFRFALDDFVPDPARFPLIALADYIKIDFQASDARTRREIYAMAAGTGIRMIAEKIESQEEMQAARAEGCSLFQGYFFARPTLVTSRVLPQNQLIYLQLLSALDREPGDLRQVEELVMSDASLCYRVLRLANSAACGRRGIVTTVRGALLMIGEYSMRRMITVALAGLLAGKRCPPLVSMALARARFCELLAPEISEEPRQLYLLGMLSLLDVLLDAPMAEILQSLPLSDYMKTALTGGSSLLNQVFELIRSLESCDWDACVRLQNALGLKEDRVAEIYLKSVQWAANMIHR